MGKRNGFLKRDSLPSTEAGKLSNEISGCPKKVRVPDLPKGFWINPRGEVERAPSGRGS